MVAIANVYLGPLGTELLPVIKYIGSFPPYPVTIEPQTEEAKMSDGSRRWAFFDKKYAWGLGWGYLTKTELDALIALITLKQILKFQDNYYDNTVYDVVIVSFSCEHALLGARQLLRYKVDMKLREA